MKPEVITYKNGINITTTKQYFKYTKFQPIPTIGPQVEAQKRNPSAVPVAVRSIVGKEYNLKELIVAY